MEEQPFTFEMNKFLTEFYARIEYERGNIDYATMVKLVNTTDLKSVATKLVGSSPTGRTSLWDCFDEKM